MVISNGKCLLAIWNSHIKLSLPSLVFLSFDSNLKSVGKIMGLVAIILITMKGNVKLHV